MRTKQHIHDPHEWLTIADQSIVFNVAIPTKRAGEGFSLLVLRSGRRAAGMRIRVGKTLNQRTHENQTTRTDSRPPIHTHAHSAPPPPPLPPTGQGIQRERGRGGGDHDEDGRPRQGRRRFECGGGHAVARFVHRHGRARGRVRDIRGGGVRGAVTGAGRREGAHGQTDGHHAGATARGDDVPAGGGCAPLPSPTPHSQTCPAPTVS